VSGHVAVSRVTETVLRHEFLIVTWNPGTEWRNVEGPGSETWHADIVLMESAGQGCTLWVHGTGEWSHRLSGDLETCDATMDELLVYQPIGLDDLDPADGWRQGWF
jgi:hypothetical protein